MTAVKTYRAAGIIASLAVKAPCVVATTANITLNGEQTVNGVAVVDGNRVLVKDQTDSSDNGVYVASTGDWARAADFDGNRDVTNGTLVVIASSALVGIYQLTATNPVTVGTTALTFTLLSAINVAGNLASVATGQGASLVAIEDAAGNFTSVDVEAALAEIYTDLASAANGLGASLVGIEDVAGNLTATNVEAALAELYQTGTFQSTVTGGTGGVNTTFAYTIVGRICTLHITGIAAVVTSTTTAMTLPNLPAAVQPVSDVAVTTFVFDNGITGLVPALARVLTDTITFSIGSPFSTAGFTAINAKGLRNDWSITYPLS